MRRIVLPCVLVFLTGCHTRPVQPAHNVPATPVREQAQPAKPAEPYVPQRETQYPEKIEAPAVPPPAEPATIIAAVNERLLDIYFDYDRAELRPDALAALETDAAQLGHVLGLPGLAVWIEGHCDERGSAEYNLGLGDSRASRVAEMLRNLGLAQAEFRTISYGREKPQCYSPVESCWQKNRRAHLVVREKNAMGN